ncbi:MAG: DUF6062 family protein [Desulfurococcales archaeon]|nr:DUF6062 family protein [Desulfurococcales archaeon]
MYSETGSECKDIFLPIFKDSLKNGNCPICTILGNYEVNILESILYERVNDPEVRRKFIDSMGLCKYHAWLIVELSERSTLVDNLGPSLLYRDILAKYIRDGHSSKKGTCPICRDVASYEKMIVKWIAKCMDNSDWFRSLYANGKAVFCDNHYHRIIGQMRNPHAIKEFESIHRDKLKSILIRIESYISKKDYRSKEEIKEEEVYAWIDALKALKGDRSFRGCSG